jgi:hypothetical protein
MFAWVEEGMRKELKLKTLKQFITSIFARVYSSTPSKLMQLRFVIPARLMEEQQRCPSR